MPTYDYICPKCKNEFDEVRTIFSYSKNPSTKCPECKAKCGSDNRDFSKIKPQFSGTAVQNPEYNPGLGQVVKNKYHRSEICKKKGYLEVGNDFTNGDNMQKEFEKKKKEEIEANWAKEPSSYSV